MKKQLVVLASALALVLVSPLAEAVATAKYALTNTGWQDLGVGPMLLSFRGNGVFAVGDVTPVIPVGEGFSVLSGASYRVETASHVWGSATGSAGVTVYVSAY
jgi:hypothetical protein